MVNSDVKSFPALHYDFANFTETLLYFSYYRAQSKTVLAAIFVAKGRVIAS